MDTLDKLRKGNVDRHEEFVPKGVSVDLSFRGNELGGEAGEACNEIKKLERLRLGLVGGKRDLQPLIEELADTVISVDLIAMDLGIDLKSAIINKFNKTSEKHNLKTRLS